ncbi:MAG: DNA alkylation repair protein [Balneolaceae bacterium]|nr:MAG: DNA alkylation repair protein [Balneolaceae bacterium]
MQKAKPIKQELHSVADPDIAAHSGRFFKTGPGEYGEGDKFLGIRVPVVRKIGRKYQQLPLNEIEHLIRSPYHEERLLALFILTYKFPKSDEQEQEQIYNFYLAHIRYVNNWDLVDSSAPKIIGAWLMDRPKELLYKLATSDNLWERRISILATFHFIKNGQFEDTLKIADLLLEDDHDLIHKAVGWMLREIGNRDPNQLTDFLESRHEKMPRTMLRYAIEKLPEKIRTGYLKR